MVDRKVCFSEVALLIHGVSCRPIGVVHQRTVEEGITGWWCQLASIGIFGGLDLLWYGPCLGFDWLPPGVEVVLLSICTESVQRDV